MRPEGPEHRGRAVPARGEARGLDMLEGAEGAAPGELEEAHDDRVIAEEVPDHADAAELTGAGLAALGVAVAHGEGLLGEDIGAGLERGEGEGYVGVGGGSEDDGLNAEDERLVEGGDEGDAGGAGGGFGAAARVGVGDGDELRAGALDEDAEQVRPPRPRAGERDAEGGHGVAFAQRAVRGSVRVHAPRWGYITLRGARRARRASARGGPRGRRLRHRGLKTGMAPLYENRREVKADRIVNAVAAFT